MDPQPLTIVDALAQISFALQGRLETYAGAHELSLIQTRLLGVLRDREPTINELSELLGLDKSSVSGLVARAERRGLVMRRRSEADGRSVKVMVTESGHHLVNEVAGQFGSEVREMLKPLTQSQESQLLTLLTTVLTAASGGSASA